MIGAPLGVTVHLECLVEASPVGIDLWYKDGEMVVSSDRCSTSVVKLSPYALRMTLTIQRFRPSDVGRYICRAKNSLGEDDSSIRLYEMSPRTRDGDASSSGRTTAMPTSAAGADKRPTASPPPTTSTGPGSGGHGPATATTAATTPDPSGLLLANNRLKPTATAPRLHAKGPSSASSSAGRPPPRFSLCPWALLLLTVARFSSDD